MKYANEARAEGVPVRTGEILYEAMPWLKQVTGKTIVIKYGGSAMENPQLAAEVMADIVLLKILGVNPVLVHGGGKAINRAFAKFDLPVEFVDGQRVTTDDAMDLVRMVLTGEVNQQLVEAMNAHGNMGVGVSGTDAGIIVAEQADPGMSVPIEDLNLTQRSYNCLKREGIHTIGELVAHTEQDLLDIRNFGMKSIDEVKEKLQSLGLALKASPLGNFDTNNLEGGTFFSPEDE